MALSETQTGVLKRMAIGALTALTIIIAGAAFNPFDYSTNITVGERLAVAIEPAIFVMLFLAISIGRLARHRFFSAEDIAGGGLSVASEQAKTLQTLLQNTLEQSVLAVFVYVAWALLMPSSWLSVIPLAAVAFCIGRVLFFTGYSSGSPSRALGFTLTFYPSLGMLFGIIGMATYRLIG